MDYFKNPALGSTELAAFIDHPDKTFLDVEPTGFMEAGKIFEDLIEEETTGKPVFSDKYFKSDMELKPESAVWKKILPLFERESLPTEEEIFQMYIYTKAGDRNKTYDKFHCALDQIKAHDFRRLVPANIGDGIYKMLDNFKRVELYHSNLFDILQGYKARFQVERFWRHESGAECKMKSDIEVFWKDASGDWNGFNIDLKVTANFASFVQNWKKKYIWQYMHYSDGFGRYCEENGIIQHPMLYVICESSAPHLVNIWDLAGYEIEALKPEYNQHVSDWQNWKEAGSPVKGYREKQTVDRYGRIIED